LKGWNAQQGFYVYRNERLLLAGDWLGLFKKEEHYKLARIMIDIPNTLDHEWQIDIKKSTAALPYGLRTILRTYATKVRGQAVDVYKHRGKTLQRKFAQEEFYHVWNEKVRRGKRYYEINREHPLIQKCLETQDPLFKQQLQQLLKCVEETVPIPLIVLRESEQSDMHIQPFEEIDHTLLRASMQQMYAYWLQSGKNEETAKRLLLNTEPFHLYPQYIELL
jgi:hypothetical protein